MKWKTEGILRDADLHTLANAKTLVKGLLDGKTETDAFSDYSHIPRACVSGENIKLLFAQTVAQCKIACDAMAATLAVEFGVPYKCLWIGCFFCGSYFQKDAAHYYHTVSTQSLHSHGSLHTHSRYGGEDGHYKSGDCQLQSSADKTDCDGSSFNLDLYIKTRGALWA